jgi:hypothetical protein
MRKGISKKLRFEIFKRDKFTCQYCGESAPKVILHIDHIYPLSKGGENDIMNLITSCQSCNAGKSNKILSDNEILLKRKHQLDIIQERKNQLEMLATWQKQLIDEEDQSLTIVSNLINELYGRVLTEIGVINYKKFIKQFGVVEVCEAINIAYIQYYDGTEDSINTAFRYVGGICYNRKYGRIY